MAELHPAVIRLNTIKKMADDNRDAILRALPKFINLDRFIQIWFTTIRRSPKLQECTPISLVACLITSAQLGLELDPALGEAFPVPFRNKGVMEAQLIPGYRGLMKLARNSEDIRTIEARVVYDKDQFDYWYGLEPDIKHNPWKEPDKGELRAAYSVAKFKNGGVLFEVMERDEIEAIKRRSPSARQEQGPWITDEPMMWRKTVVRRFSKYLPADPTFQRAAALDEKFEMGEPQDIDVPFDVEGEVDDERSTLDRLADQHGGGEEGEREVEPPETPQRDEGTGNTETHPMEMPASPGALNSVRTILDARRIPWEIPADLTQGEAMTIIECQKEKDKDKLVKRLKVMDKQREA